MIKHRFETKPWKMGERRSSETSVYIYKSVWCNKPGDENLSLCGLKKGHWNMGRRWNRWSRIFIIDGLHYIENG